MKKLIDQFLYTVARWDPTWFNKPKFHIILHLPDHIKRLGPAPLFATEAFESYNALIRTESVHSNRQAPSRDIALAFAHSNRVRHLISGGQFYDPEFLVRKERLASNRIKTHGVLPELPYDEEASSWKVAAKRVLSLMDDPDLHEMMGNSQKLPIPGVSSH